MRGDRVCIDGTLRERNGTEFDTDRLLSSGYLYQRIHTLAHRPLHDSPGNIRLGKAADGSVVGLLQGVEHQSPRARPAPGSLGGKRPEPAVGIVDIPADIPLDPR